MKKLLTFFLITVLISCTDDKKSGPAVQITEHSTLGKILANSEGYTLYFFSRDTKKDSSVCTGQCEENWPIFYAENIAIESADLNAADFTTITRSNGDKQTAYKGWPLYTYSGDTEPGQTNGEKVNNVWYVAKPDYAIMYAKGQLVGHNGTSYKHDYTEGQEETFYLTDAKGFTLYTFSVDSSGNSKFTGNPSIWPKFILSGRVPSIFNQTDFGVIAGTQQVTFRGWPLYTFGGNGTVQGDTIKGLTRGVSFPPNQPPGYWPVANASTTPAP